MRPLVLVVALLFAAVRPALAQRPISGSEPRERRAFQLFAADVRRTVVRAADAMPADKFRFVPGNGDDSTLGVFRGVRTFGQQVVHLAATNYILAAAALGQDPPADAGDETGPDSVQTKAQVLRYLIGSYDALDRAVAAIGIDSIPVKSSPISPLQGASATRVALVAEALIHSFDHYGQMVVSLRMNGVIPPNSRP
jgi:hypothetical protein